MTLDQKTLLTLSHDMLAGLVRNDMPDLTLRQLCLILTIYTIPNTHTVRSLALHLNIAKPAVTRALDKLQDLGLLKRKADPNDGRSIIVQRTTTGAVFLSEIGEKFSLAATEVLA